MISIRSRDVCCDRLIHPGHSRSHPINPELHALFIQIRTMQFGALVLLLFNLSRFDKDVLHMDATSHQIVHEIEIDNGSCQAGVFVVPLIPVLLQLTH